MRPTLRASSYTWLLLSVFTVLLQISFSSASPKTEVRNISAFSVPPEISTKLYGKALACSKNGNRPTVVYRSDTRLVTNALPLFQRFYGRAIGQKAYAIFARNCTPSQNSIFTFPNDLNLTLIKGINLTGPDLKLSDGTFENSETTEDLIITGGKKDSLYTGGFNPPISDEHLEQLFRSSFSSKKKVAFELKNLPVGEHALMIYIRGDRRKGGFALTVNEKLVLANVDIVGFDHVATIGPIPITVTATGGAPALGSLKLIFYGPVTVSGVGIFKKSPKVKGTEVPTPTLTIGSGTPPPSMTPTASTTATPTSTKFPTVTPTNVFIPAPTPTSPPPGTRNIDATIATQFDTVPNFARFPTIFPIRSGNWSDPSVWSANRLPGLSDIVSIDSGYVVTYDISSNVGLDTVAIQAGARLEFRTDISTKIVVGNLLVNQGGEFRVGTQSSPVAPTVVTEIVIRDQPLNATVDPNQYGSGFVSFGTVNIHGSVRTPTFVRLSAAPNVGDTIFRTSQPVIGWRVGDKLVLPDSRQPLTESSSGVPHSYNQEEVVVQSISADGLTITFTPALKFNHPGTTDENGDSKPDFLPHIANLTRNIVIRSENRTGTRGHVLFTQRAQIFIENTAFVDLGRTTFNDLDAATNHIGRYSLHMHHLFGPYPVTDPKYQFRIVGNSIYENSSTTPPQKWGITVHGSHYGLVQDNVVYNVGGAGIVTEDGSESYNVFNHNIAIRILGNGGRDEHQDQPRGIAREGSGFWFRGTNNYVTNNVASNIIEGPNDVEAAYGFKFNMVYLGNIPIPNFRGADTSLVGQFTTRQGTGLGLLEFSGNEVYGQIQGLTIWWLCKVDTAPTPNCSQSLVKDLSMWNIARYTYYGYPTSNLVMDGLRVYGDPAINGQNNYEFKGLFWFGDYAVNDLLVTNSFFINIGGIKPPTFRSGSIRVQNSYFKTRSGLVHTKSNAPGSCGTCDLPDPNIVYKNNIFVPMAGHTLQSVGLDASTTDPNNKDRLFVCNHQQQAGDNFEVFFPTQGNAPCTTQRSDIQGYSCVTADVGTICSQ